MPVKIPVIQTGLEASIEAAAKKAGRNLKINMGGNAKSIEGLSQPLGRITGKADQFTKSMEAANARVLAFGASVGILSSVTRGFQDLIRVTIDVEKSLTSINSILNVTAKELDSFKSTIFSVAKNTEQSFSVVAEAALELSRQGLKAEEVTKRLNDALVLSRLSGLGASESVAGLTAAINSFNKSGITSAEVLNKLSAAAVSAAVSERDLIEGIKRSGSVATQAGVSFDELVGVITAVQAKTARGGAVIGNSFKTIFTRIQSIDKLQTMQNLGVEVTDASGQVLGATKLIQNLAKSLEEVPDARRLQIAEGLVGKFQVAPFLAILDDYISKTSKAVSITEVSQNATSEAYNRNEAQNITLSAAINKTTVSVAQLAEALGKIGVTDNLKSMLGFFTTVVDEIQEILDGDGLGSKFAKGIVAGIGNIITGPAFAVFAAVIGKLVIDLVRFGAGSLKTFFGLNKAAKEQATLQGQIASTLLGNSNIQKKILSIENSTLSVEQKRAAQTAFFTTALNEQVAIMTRMQGIAAKIAPGVMAGTRGKGRAAGGFIPNYNAIVGYGSERADISKGVGGAPSSAKPVTIPNFNFGGGQKGTMVANSSEYIVPNYAGGDGSAIFNQDMAASIGLPPRARKIGAAGGYIPNFVNEEESLVMFVGTRGTDKKRDFFVGKRGKETRAYSSMVEAQKAKLNRNSIKPIRVPVYKLNEKEGGKKPLSIKKIRKRLSKSSTDTAMQFAKSLAPKSDIPNISKNKLKNLFNPGSFEGMAGSIFEVALSGVLGSSQFKDYSSRTSNSRIDLPYDKGLFDMFGTQGRGKMGSEVKATGPLAKSAAVKFYDILVGGQGVAKYKEKIPVYDKNGKIIKGEFDTTKLGALTNKKQFEKLFPNGHPSGLGYQGINTALGGSKTKPVMTLGGLRDFTTRSRLNYAGGYIPNFAGGLQESIARESAAGLPINQIRINQDPKLRNSGNPMGLAVTNTRDEPTGAIPNFAKGSKGSTGNDGGGMSGDFLTKMFAVQIGMSALSGILGEVTEKNKIVANSLTLLNGVISAMMVSQAFGGFGNIGKFAIGGGRIGKKGAALMGRGAGQVSAGRTLLGTGLKGGARGLRVGAGNALMGTLKIVSGGLLRLAGPIGLAVTAFIAVRKAMDFFDGTSANLARNQDRLAESAKNAARELDELKIDDKEEFQSVNQGIANQFTQRIRKRGIEGSRGGEQVDQIGTLILNALNAGATNRQIEGILSGAEKNTGQKLVNQNPTYGTSMGADYNRKVEFKKVDKEFANGTANFLSTAFSNLAKRDFSGEQEDFIKSINANDRIALAGDDKELAAKVRERLMKRGVGEKGPEFDPFDSTPFVPSGNFGINTQTASGAISEAVRRGAKELEKIDQIRGDEAKVRLSTEIALMKIRAEALTSDQKSLSFAKRNNSLGSVGLLQLQQRIDLAKQDVAVNSGIADIIQKQVDANDSVTLSMKEVDFLSATFASSSLEILSNDEKREELLKSTLQTLGKSDEEIKAMGSFLDANVAKTMREGEARKEVLKTTQQQAILDARRAEVIDNITRDLNRATFREETGQTDSTRTAQRDLDRRKSLFDINNPFATDRQRASAEEGFVKDQAKINIEEKQNQVVKDTKSSLVDLIKEMPSFTGEIEELVKKIKGIGDIGLAQEFFKGVGSLKIQDESPKPNIFGMTPIGQPPESIALSTITSKQADLTAKKAAELERKQLGLAGTKEDERVNIDLAGKRKGAAGQIKFFSQLLEEFTDNLRQQAEDLKLSLLLAKDGSSAISNIDDQLFKAASKVGGAGATARASDQVALRGATDQITLARTSVDRRAAIKNRDILAKELELKTEIAIKQEDGITKEKDLIGLRTQLVELEKQRLAIGTSRAELFENEFNFTAEEIQEGLDRALVQNARTFVNTISDGLVDAIAKGQDLGDVLKQAASNFFLGEAKSNMSAAFKNITGNFFASGGPVTGGSGSKDDVPALLMGGEFVMKKSAVQKYGSGFMNSLNSGNIPAMARGGLFTPGTYGQGAMKGSRNLLDFATQSFTTGASDRFGSGSGFASIGLEPQSAALTMFGRRNSPAFQREQASKQKAFGLFTRQMEKEKAAREKGSGFSEILKNSLLSFGASFGFKKLTDVFGKKSPTADILMDKNDPTQYDNGYTFTATGGAIPNAAGVDTIPSMLSGGEFVMNAAATQRIGRGNLNALNSGGGGGSGDVVGKLDELISVSDNSGETVINITVNSDGSSNSQGNGDDQQNSLATKIKDVVKQVIDDEKRLGGSLRQARA